MKSALVHFSAIVVAVLCAGCATKGGNTVMGGGSTGTDGRFEQIQAAIEAQHREIVALRQTLADQDRRVAADVDKINESLDTHLELLDLLYREMGRDAPTLKQAPAAESRASVFGAAAIRQRRGDPLLLKRAQVFLLRDEAGENWRSLSAPRSLYNTPIQNADAILTALEFRRDLETPPGDALNERRSARALNTHLRTFEESLEALATRAASSTRDNGRYFFSDVPAGDYQIYARISPETYSVCWLIPVRVLDPGAFEVNLDEENAMVFLNDLADGGN
jgi:hypothetical protein